MNWRRPRTETPDDHFYHVFSPIPQIGEVSLYHYWLLRRAQGDPQPMEYACFKEPKLLDAKLAPCHAEGSPVMSYAWHFEPCMLSQYLEAKATELGVELIAGALERVALAADGSIAAVYVDQGRRLEADLYVDCSGADALLLREALAEPFVDARSQLCCDRILSCVVPQHHSAEGVDPFVSAIAMSAGWISKLPMLGHFLTSYVYCSDFASGPQALRELCWLWGIDRETRVFCERRFRTGRTRRAWVHNCVAIGSSWCFVEPLQTSGLGRDCEAIRRLATYFPDRPIDSAQRDRFNLEMQRVFEEDRDLAQLHYLTTSRQDAALWRWSHHALTPSATLSARLEGYGPSLLVDTPTSLTQACSSSSGYYSVLAAKGWLPAGPLPALRYRSEARHQAQRAFDQLRQDSDQLYALLPTNYEWLRQLHGAETIPRSGGLAAPRLA